MSNGTQPVILLGAQRSGTTVLGTVLSAAFADTGSLFTNNGKLPYVLHRWCTEADLRGQHLRVDEMMHALRRKPPYGPQSAQWLEATERVLRAAARQVADGRAEDAVALRGRLVRDAYAGGARFGDKYNEYLLELDHLAGTVPDAHWVLLIRHPADVAHSMLGWTGDRPWRPDNRMAALDKWVAWHEPWLRHPRATDPGLCTVLEYRRLCAGEDLRRLSAALGLDLLPYAGLLQERPGEPDPAPLPGRVAHVWRSLLERRLQ